jgi:hypothetical protein
MLTQAGVGVASVERSDGVALDEGAERGVRVALAKGAGLAERGIRVASAEGADGVRTGFAEGGIGMALTVVWGTTERFPCAVQYNGCMYTSLRRTH